MYNSYVIIEAGCVFMDSALQHDVALFCDSFLQLKRPLMWKTTSYYTKLCALAYALEGRRPNMEEFLEALKVLKKKTGFFSYLRSARPYIAAFLLAGGKSPETEIEKISHCYSVLKAAGFRSSTYLPIAAHTLYTTTAQGSEEAKAQAAHAIYREMKHNHPFLTSSDDYASAVILASTDQPVDKIMAEVENTYSLLRRSGFHIGNGLQFLSQMLIFDPASPEEKAVRCTFIKEKLRENKNRVSSMFYGTIGFLALTGDHWENAVHKTLETLEYIKEHRCYRWGEREFHLLLSAALVCNHYSKVKDQSNSSLLRLGVGATIEAIIAAQTAACCAAAAAGASASASSK